MKLMSPVADRVMLKAAIDSGSDAVYFGVKQLNMRANAKNFEVSELKKIVTECHKSKVKAFLTVNTIIYEDELPILKKTLKAAKQAKIDAIICWDFSVIQECKKLKLPIHISTQASASNYEAVKFFAKLGAESINLARELTLGQISDIVKKAKKDKIKIEIETFVHGAMCVSVSGRCFLSQEIFKKSANRGDCLQPCRREYIITDPEEHHKLKLGKDFVMSPKDLCTLPILDKLAAAGISRFKIEGRNRSPEYVKTTTEVYKKAIDAIKNKKFTKTLKTTLTKKLTKVYNRGFHTGFFLGTPTADDFTKLYGSAATQKKLFVGYINNYYSKIKVAEVKIESNHIKKGDKLMVQGNKTGVIEFTVKSMQKNHKDIASTRKGDRIAVKCAKQLRPNDKVFVIR